MNLARVLAGGLAAAVVCFLADSVVFGALLSEAYDEAVAAVQAV